MYFGEANTALDDKGRITVPVQFRAVMEVNDHDTWYLTRGFDGAIFMFSASRWQEIVQQTATKASLDPRLLDFRRFFIGGATKVKRDAQGRMAIPSHLREYASINKQAVLLGVDDHLELWSDLVWREFQERQAGSYKEMAALLFGATPNEAASTEGAA